MIIKNKKISGFTLIEVMVASIIFAITTIMGYTALNVLIKQAEGFSTSVKSFQNLEKSLNIIRNDLTYLVNRPVTSSSGGKQNAFVVREKEQGYYFLEFTRSNIPMSGLRFTSNLRRVAYRIDKEKLMRHTWFALDQPPNSLPIEQELMDGVTDVEVESFDKNEWKSVWLKTGLPKVIRFKITTKAYGEIEILIPGVDPA